MELYLYGPIIGIRVEEDILPQLDQAEKAEGEEQVTMRVNSPGGSVASGWGICAKLSEMQKKTVAKIDGVAASMASVVINFADEVEALDVSKVMIHRAVGPEDTEEERNLLAQVNKDLKGKLKNKLDLQKFQEITGTTLDSVFDTNKERQNIWLSATQAKQVGLVDRVSKVENSQARAELESSIAAMALPDQNITSVTAGDTTNQNDGNMSMDAATLRAQYPEIIQAIENQGYEKGKEDERERVNSFLAYHDADPKNVVEKIQNGEQLKPSMREDYIKKLQTQAVSGAMAGDSPQNVTPGSDGSGNPSGDGSADGTVQNEVNQLWEAVKPEINNQ